MGRSSSGEAFLPVPVDNIDVGPEQARTRKVDKDLDELAESMKRWGLVHPITVYEEGGKYHLLAGQRRLLAAKQLGWTTISAKVVEKPEHSIEAKGLSLSESFVRTDLSQADIIDAVTAFYNHYGDSRLVASELALSTKKVNQYLKYPRLPQQLKELVDSEKVELREALRAADASELPDGIVDVEKAVTIAQGLKALTRDQRRQLHRVAEENPTATADEILEEAKKPPRLYKYVIHLAAREAEALNKAAAHGGLEPEETAERALIEWLTKAGFL